MSKKDKKPKIVVLCGSSRYVQEMSVVSWLIERDEHAITMGLHLLPSWYSGEKITDHLAEYEGVSEAMDRLHLQKIEMADEVFIVNRNDYIGISTSNEIKHAISLNKTLRWYTHDPVGEEVEKLIDEARIS